MNMKAMMFAGLGLFAAMVPTTMWISSDMRAIQAKEHAKLEAQCAQRPQAPSVPATATDPMTMTPTAQTMADPGAGPQEDPCATLDGTAGVASGQPSPTASTGGAVDPVSGLPIADPYAATAGIDPAAQPIDSSGYASSNPESAPLVGQAYPDSTGVDSSGYDSTGAPVAGY